MIFEMRQYSIERGRMHENHERMKNHLPALFDRHGMRVVGSWTAQSGPRMPAFCYILEWQDLAVREASWLAFYADPETAEILAATALGGSPVEVHELAFLRPNPAFEGAAADFERRIDGIHQIIIQRVRAGRVKAVVAFLAATYLPRLRAAGAHVIGVCDMISGRSMPNVVMFLAWPDERAWWRGWRAFQDDLEVRDAFQAQRAGLGTTLFGMSEIFVLEPAPYALPFASLRTRSLVAGDAGA
jgi:hypothetical protein